MTKNIKLILVLAIFCELALIKAKVYHENHIRKRRNFQDSNESILNQERHLKLKKFRRSVGEQAGSFPLDDLHATQFDLKKKIKEGRRLLQFAV